jgi:hypothetical protein
MSDIWGAPAPLNGIPATMHHDEGAYAQCGDCGRYTVDPFALSARPRPCDCGSTTGWSGSFKKPGPDAKWSGRAPGVTGTDTDAAIQRSRERAAGPAGDPR